MEGTTSGRDLTAFDSSPRLIGGIMSVALATYASMLRSCSRLYPDGRQDEAAVDPSSRRQMLAAALTAIDGSTAAVATLEALLTKFKDRLPKAGIPRSDGLGGHVIVSSRRARHELLSIVRKMMQTVDEFEDRVGAIRGVTDPTPRAGSSASPPSRATLDMALAIERWFRTNPGSSTQELLAGFEPSFLATLAFLKSVSTILGAMREDNRAARAMNIGRSQSAAE